MKTKIFRIGKRSLSVVLTLMMLVTMFAVPVNAATIDNDPVGATTTYYLWYGIGNSTCEAPTSYVNAGWTKDSSGNYTVKITSTNGNYEPIGFLVNTSSSSGGAAPIWGNSASGDVVKGYIDVTAVSSLIDNFEGKSGWYSDANRAFAYFKFKKATTLVFTFNPTTNKITITPDVASYDINCGTIGGVGTVTHNQSSNKVSEGGSVKFTVTHENLDYYNIQWYKDSAGTQPIEGAINSTYTVSNVKDAVNAYAKLTLKQYEITGTSGDNGSVSPVSGTKFNAGSNVTLTAKPNDGYYVSSFTANCDNVDYPHTNGTITINGAAANIVYEATFTAKPVINFSLTDSANSGAEISATYDGAEISSGDGIIPGKTAVFTVTGAEDTGLYTVTWDVNGTTSTGSSVTVENVTATTNVTATVTRNTYTVSGTTSSNATVTVTGVDSDNKFNAGSEITITVDVEEGHQLVSFTATANGKTYESVDNTITISGAKSDVDYTVTTRELVFSVELSADKTTIKEGETATLTATVENGSGDYTYTFTSSNTDEILSWVDNTLTVSPTDDTTYTVTVKDNTYPDKAPVTASITITIASTNIQSLTISSDKDTVLEGESFTLSVVPVPAGTYTYNYYKVIDGTALKIQSTKKSSITVNESTLGTHTYYVTVMGIDSEFKSNEITVTVNKSAGKNHEITVYFKAPTAAMYLPTITVNGIATTMEKPTVLGTNCTGTLTVAWYSAVVTVDSTTENNTLTFTTKRTKLNASITGNFNNDTYYFACDDLMYGTEVVDLTAKDEYIKNFFLSATHMVYPTTPTGGQEDQLGYTVVGGVTYRMGAYITSQSAQTVSVDSVTLSQFVLAKTKTVSDVQSDILDVNLDGVLDVNDTTFLQLALAAN